MKMGSPTRRFRASPPPHALGAHVLAGLLVAAVIFAGTWPSGGRLTGAQESGSTAECNASHLYKARISWTATERYLAAPDASPDVVAALTNVITQVYRPDWSLDIVALDALSSPAFREMTGLDCTGVTAPPLTDSDVRPVLLDQVRQADETTVSAFVVLPGYVLETNPDLAQKPDGSSTPDTDTTQYDAVTFVVFVQRGGEWNIDYLSGGIVKFSDVVPNDKHKREIGANLTVRASILRDGGLPAIPTDMALIASPEASPAG